MLYYLGEVVTMTNVLVGTIEYMDEDMDYYEILGVDGNIYTCTFIEIL